MYLIIQLYIKIAQKNEEHFVYLGKLHKTA